MEFQTDSQWLILLTNNNQDTAVIYIQDLTREEGLFIIESQFENGRLTGERYTKKSLSHWQYLDHKHLYFFNQKGYNQWLSQQNNRKP